LRSIAADTHFPLKLRKLLSERILRLKTAVTGAIKFRRRTYVSWAKKYEAGKREGRGRIKLTVQLGQR
jgi:hypothetical protein